MKLQNASAKDIAADVAFHEKHSLRGQRLRQASYWLVLSGMMASIVGLWIVALYLLLHRLGWWG